MMMFRTDICKALFDSIWKEISHIIELIQNVNLEEAGKQLELLTQTIIKKIDAFSDDFPDDVFNEGYILKEFVKLFEDYVSYWKLVVSNKFSDSWSSLQDVQDRLRTIYRFTDEPRALILSRIERQCGELEKLYPYRVFASIGIVKEEAECSICGKSIDSFECEHIAGELYRGRRAYGIINQVKQLEEVSLVTNPADKRCVVQILDTSEQFNGVTYLAKGIRDKVLAPLDLYQLEFSKIRTRNNEISIVGRNEPCPCGSGKKFKKCCIDKNYIESTHVEIIPRNVDITKMLLPIL